MDIPGGMILEETKSSMFKTHHISINNKEQDWLEIYDGVDMVSIKLRNECAQSKPYYYLEIDKESELWQNMIEAINDCSKKKKL